MSAFFRFPHTPHLAWLGTEPPRNDKLLSAAEAGELLSGEVIVEEKLDGANLGISVTESGAIRFQSRGQFLQPPFSPQFGRLNSWIGQHGQSLADLLDPGLILFGEWLAARHSVPYRNLPDWFVAFDIYDEVPGLFWSVRQRDLLLRSLELPVAPCLFRGQISLTTLTTFVAQHTSRFGAAPLEGVIVRRDEGDFNMVRAKLVAASFTQGLGEHWRRRQPEWNQVAAHNS